MHSEFRAICRVQDVPPGEGRMFLVDERRLAVFHLGERFLVLDDECPHAGASLARGRVEGDCVACRIHYWRFRLSDGVCLDPPHAGHDVTAYPVRVREGQVEVAVT